jgi:uncharacterized protein
MNELEITAELPAMTAPPPSNGWNPLPRKARWPTMIGYAILALIVCGTSCTGVFIALVKNENAGVMHWSIAILAVLGLFVYFLLLGHWSWKHTAWFLDEAGLHVRRGRFWHKHILIPHTRVQHLEIERGPIERKFGLSTLVVHTAGTRMHALRQSGLLAEDAEALRNALIPRERVQDDVI